MTALLRNFWQTLIGRGDDETLAAPAPIAERRVSAQAAAAALAAVDIAPSDPLVAHFQAAPSVAEIDRLHLNSPAPLLVRRRLARRVFARSFAVGQSFGLHSI